MPICTSCTHPLPHLYSLYASANNLRLEQCTQCHAVADPYVEHDSLILLLDLILLKRDVFRHLIYNRGSLPRRLQPENHPADDKPNSALKAENPEKTRCYTVISLGVGLVLVDAFTRWTRLHPITSAFDAATSETNTAVADFGRMFFYCLGETIVFQCGITAAVAVLVPLLSWIFNLFRVSKTIPYSVPSLFRLSHVPLALLYASLTKFFLLFLLSIWAQQVENMDQEPIAGPKLELFTQYPTLHQIYTVFDDGTLDREWVVRNVLGGMAAGFGLRVVLNSQPVLIMNIIIIGWASKAAYVYMVDDYLGMGPPTPGNGNWTRYSIP